MMAESYRGVEEGIKDPSKGFEAVDRDVLMLGETILRKECRLDLMLFEHEYYPA